MAVRKSKPKAKKKSPPAASSKKEILVGVVTHFFGKLKVAIIRFKKPVRLGTEVRIEGATTNFKQKISSMQHNHKPLKLAPKAKQVGIKVTKRVRVGDKLYLI